jgi:putative chitinase
MDITQKQLLDAVPGLYKARLDEFVASFNMFHAYFGLNTRDRIIHYLAQVFHESGSLRYVEELSSGAQYEGRKDLGNTQKGDGKRFKGRGFIQLTGRKNYQDFYNDGWCSDNIVAYPNLVSNFPLNQMVSMWFWDRNNLNDLADLDNGTNGEDIVKKITRKVNGGYNGLDERVKFYQKFKKIIKE